MRRPLKKTKQGTLHVELLLVGLVRKKKTLPFEVSKLYSRKVRLSLFAKVFTLAVKCAPMPNKVITREVRNTEFIVFT